MGTAVIPAVLVWQSAIAKGEAPANACPVGGEPVGREVAKIMGVEAGKSEKQVAFVHCQGTEERIHKDYDYYGVEDCLHDELRAGRRSQIPATASLWRYGTCAKLCPFDAIHVKDGVAVVDREKNVKPAENVLPHARQDI